MSKDQATKITWQQVSKTIWSAIKIDLDKRTCKIIAKTMNEMAQPHW